MREHQFSVPFRSVFSCIRSRSYSRSTNYAQCCDSPVQHWLQFSTGQQPLHVGTWIDYYDFLKHATWNVFLEQSVEKDVSEGRKCSIGR